MATLSETKHPGGFLVWEASRDYTRESVTIAAGTLEPGTVLGKITASGQISLALRSLDDKGDGIPKLADDYRNPRRAATGPLIIRYGLERPLRRP